MVQGPALVDTGARMLVLPEELHPRLEAHCDERGLTMVSTAGGPLGMRMVYSVNIIIVPLQFRCKVQTVFLPKPGSDFLAGMTVIADLDMSVRHGRITLSVP